MLAYIIHLKWMTYKFFMVTIFVNAFTRIVHKKRYHNDIKYSLIVNTIFSVEHE